MKNELLRKHGELIASLTLLLWLTVVSPAVAGSTTNDLSRRIISKTHHPITSLIFAHIDPVNVLIIDGKRFENVRGLEKFYLFVPQIDAVVFVVDEKDHTVAYHLYKMDTREDLVFRASHSVFGETIGAPNSRDSVEQVQDGIMILCNLDQDAKSTLPSLATLRTLKSLYYLDLRKKAVVADKSLFYDASGKLLLEYDASPPF